MRRHRWNTIGRTRRKLAEILTLAVQAREDEKRAIAIREHRMKESDFPRFVFQVKPEDISAMRLAGKARIWEDAHSWEAWPTYGDGDKGIASVYSYDSMTEVVRAGGIEWIGKDGECVAKARKR